MYHFISHGEAFSLSVILASFTKVRISKLCCLSQKLNVTGEIASSHFSTDSQKLLQQKNGRFISNTGRHIFHQIEQLLSSRCFIHTRA